MSLPALTRTWQFQVNQNLPALGSLTLCCAWLMYLIKQSLVGAGAWTDSTGGAVASAGNWAVRSSCSGAGGGGSFGNGDGVDRWTSGGAGLTNLVWAAAGSNHSWIVLRQTGIAPTFELLIDLSNASAISATITVAFNAGFNLDGTATAAPTVGATDSKVLIANTNWGGPNGIAPMALHVLKSSDGASTRVISLRSSNNGSGGWTTLFWLFELPKTNIAAWTNPSFAVALGSLTLNPNSGVDSVANLSQAANTWSRTPGGTIFSSQWSATGTQQHAILSDAYGSINGGQQNIGDVSAEAPLWGIGCYSATVNARGRNGVLADIRLALENIGTGFAITNGRTYPTSAPLRQQAQFGDFSHPWNRSKPLWLT